MDTLQSFSGEKPTHIAVIMDGNGRWANARGLPRTAGHRQGAESVRRTVKAAMKLGIPYLTLYGFSSENWSRPMAEVEDLMGLLRRYLRSELAKFHENGIRLQVIGQRDRLPGDIVRLIEDAEKTTKDNDQLTLVMALSYGGRQDITTAARRVAEAVAAGKIKPEELDETRFGSYLWTDGIPDPDLLIRTSGEQRISNFLLWQSAYSELVFVEKLWPDFDEDDLADAIREYQRRDRRFGAAADSG
ncbi:isoprenyl transferase [Pelagibius sp. Alg239-R121]|uniref:isoprenyl transferase n=1 Tax=Pelagibius sp. Alg239-R121 TaxID=2993448 RepID=UPI0024A6CF99|nr:isoprenyl transferase [Pelagibius sp. Alg239-R121]